VEFGLLGLLEVVDGHEGVTVGRGKESSLLAILLLHANEPVSADRLIRELWGERSPENAAKSVQQYVSRLRKSLGAERLLTTPGGYVLQVEPDELDCDRFQRLATEGRSALESGDAKSADRLLSTALGLWRAPALADFRYDGFAQEAIRRLESERREASADRVDARIALGQEDRVLPELRGLIEEDPHWERPRGQLMLALYREGRQSDALEVYRETRAVFDSELGLEPSRDLQELERSILNHDPALEGQARQIRVLRSRRRGAKLLVAAGGILVVAGVVAAVLALTSGASPAQGGNVVAGLGASAGQHLSYTRVGTTPGNVVVGEGGVWVLNTDDRTISHIDPATRRVLKTFATSGEPTDLAAGDGALWVGSSATGKGLIETSSATVAVSRVDPASTAVTKTTHLSSGSRFEFGQTLGVSAIAIGRRAVWAVDPDGSISRIEPATGTLVARVDAARATAIAAGGAGVWFLTSVRGGPAVASVDPRTNRVGQIIPVQTPKLVGIAVGAGSVWATDPYSGVIWRIDPGPKPIERTVSLGFGVTQIAFGEGAVWVANIANGTVSRVDPRTEKVTTTLKLAGTPQSLAVGYGSAWTSIAGATSKAALPASACSPVESSVANPDLLVVSDLPLQGPSLAPTLAAAVRFVLHSHGFRAGRYTIGYQSCDDSTARTESADFFKCASNARDFGAAGEVVAVIGPYDSSCAQVEIPVTNRAPAGAVAIVSPSNTFPSLTRADPNGPAGAPGILYPTGTRNYFRLAPPDDLQGAGDAVLAKQLDLGRVYVLSDGGIYGSELSRGFRTAAHHLGLAVVGSGVWNPEARNYVDLVASVARTKARGILLAGYGSEAGGLIRALRGRFGSHLTMIAGDGFFPIPDTLKGAGPAANGMYVSLAGVVTQDLTPAGRRLLAAFEATQQGGPVLSGTALPETLEAAEIVVDAIARSDGTRGSVVQELHRSKVRGGAFGSFAFDRNGDMTPAPFAILRITGGRGAAGLASDFRGAVVDRTVRAPIGLLRNERTRGPG
jgi:DNA-binding SARP family transcriptional activator/ABC-type branched-subunit amino acid transport system substrate-binding protein